MRVCFLTSFVLLLLLMSAPRCQAAPNEREQKVRGDKEKMEADEFWIYNDLEEGRLVAKREGKPLMVVYRCIP